MRATQNQIRCCGTLLAALLSAAACGDEDARERQPGVDAAQEDGSAHDGGAFGDGSAHDGGTFHDAATHADGGTAPTCAQQPGSCPAQSIAKWKVLLDAADFGAGAHLIALGGQAVLVAVGDGSFRVALINDDEEGTGKIAYSSWSFAGGERVPVAISGAATARGERLLFVLSCEKEGANCAIARAQANGEQLSPWQSTDLPSGVVGRGLAFDAISAQESICVYGNGLVCWSGGLWQEAVAPEPTLHLNDVFISGLWSLAIGDDGRWFKREVSESGALSAWQEQPALGSTPLTYASVSRAGAVIVGEGKLHALGEQTQDFPCAPEGLVALSLDDAAPGLAYALTDRGQVLQHPPRHVGSAETFCSYEQLPAGTVLDVSRAYCADSINPRVLLDNAVFGTNLCIHIL